MDELHGIFIVSFSTIGIAYRRVGGMGGEERLGRGEGGKNPS